MEWRHIELEMFRRKKKKKNDSMPFLDHGPRNFTAMVQSVKVGYTSGAVPATAVREELAC